MSKKVDVLIYFEHVSRELDSCFMLKHELEKLGLTAEIVPVHRNRYRNVMKFRPRMIVVPFLFADEKDRTLEFFNTRYGKVECLNLHHEQFYNEVTKSLMMPKNDLSRQVYHLSWTGDFARDLTEVGIPEELIMVCGNPRTDNYFLIPSRAVAKHKEGYREMIFIPTSFSWVFVEEDYFLKNAKLDPERFYLQKAVGLSTVPVFFRTVRDSAASHPDKKFILRPHPFEDIDKYKKALLESKEGPLEPNLEVVREGNVYDWMRVSDLVVGWFTTVSMEAQLFGRRNFIYQPTEMPDWMQMEFIKLYDEIVRVPERFEQIISDIESYNPANPALSAFVDKSFGTADGKVSARIAENIRRILLVTELPDHKKKRGEIFRKSITVDIPKNLLVRLGLISRYNDIFSGITEDMLSNRSIRKKYKNFLKRIEE